MNSCVFMQHMGEVRESKSYHDERQETREFPITLPFRVHSHNFREE